VLKVRAPSSEEVQRLKEGSVLLALLDPASNGDLIDQLAARRVSSLALERIPRISRAQSMDVLSSMASVAGYEAVLMAATRMPKFFPMMMTAAGTIKAAHVLVIGAGVAGLQAIGTAKRLGARVFASDVRPAAREEVESLGARFVGAELLDEAAKAEGGYAKEQTEEQKARQKDVLRDSIRQTDIIICSALVAGGRASVVLDAPSVEVMKSGSVIIGLAAEQGGNCELTEPGKSVDRGGVKIVGYTDLTSRMPRHASQMFSANVAHLLKEMGGGDNFSIDEENDAIRGALVLRDGVSKWPPPEIPVFAPPPIKAKTGAKAKSRVIERVSPPPPPARKPLSRAIASLVAAVGLSSLALYAPQEFIQHFTVFVLACFIGWQVVWNVAPALHTPLMSVTNAISGIILIGGLLKGASGEVDLAALLGTIAVLVASINVFGGFLVTHRMLKMFRK